MRPLPSFDSRNVILHGDCIKLMRRMAEQSVDFVLTDPPYLCNYRDRGGRVVRNDDNARWLAPAFREIYRVMKPGSLCLSFYGWHQADTFIQAWRAAGFRIVGHIVFAKPYASSKRFLGHHHEQAYLLAKGDAPLPSSPPSDVRNWRYTGNRLHPTQKPVESLEPLIAAYTRPGELVFDPFCGSGSSLVAAKNLGRQFLGFELDYRHARAAKNRLAA